MARIVTTVPASEVSECWDILHRAHAMWHQAYDEGIDIEKTEWSGLYKMANDIDDQLWQKYHTPCCFFMDTINQAIKRKLTYQEYLAIIHIYGIEVM